MVSRRNRTLASLSLFLAVWAWSASAAAIKGETAAVDVGALTSPQIEEQLQVINQCRVSNTIMLQLTDIRTALSSRLSMLVK
jgi:zinc transporter 7